jgi:5-methylcytosine-specific restriction endonuclease McrA
MQMKSIAHGLKKGLEARGEYVVMANAITVWFAVFLRTWRRRTEGARRDGREGPNLVVYRTRSDNARDHYVVPYSVIRDLLVESTMTTSEVNGTQRWNLTLKNGNLHVSHRRGAVDVSKYHGARLLSEEAGFGISEDVAHIRPSVDSPEILQLKRQLDDLQPGMRPQNPEVLRKIQRVLKLYERTSSITRYVKQTRGSTCQLCGEFGFVKRNGKRYCEVHHLFHLSTNPPASCLAPEFLIVLCATCHRRMHYADVGEPIREDNGWRVRVDDTEHHFGVEVVSPDYQLQRT